MRPTLSKATSAFDTGGLAVIDTMANVAFDVFFDTEMEKAINTTAPSYEVMVWIGKYGPVLPIGATSTTDASKLPKLKIGKETL